MGSSYWVTGTDGREYGPVPIETIGRWIGEGRLIPSSLVRVEGSAPTEARLVPEIAAIFADSPRSGGVADPASTQVFAPLAEFRVWGFFGQAWELVKIHWLPLAAIVFINGLLTGVPYLGTCVAFIIGGALQVGIWRAFLGAIDGRPPRVGMMFEGFDMFGDAILAYFITLFLIGLGCVFLIVPGIILALMWLFTFPVLAENRLSFWEAMKRSAVLTEGYRWRLFLLCLACIPILLLGLVVLCVGVFVAAAVCMTAFGLAYRWLVAKKRAAPAFPATTPA
jgi:uncharacterized membrane protein